MGGWMDWWFQTGKMVHQIASISGVYKSQPKIIETTT